MKNIILTGFMGTGKTAVGRRLAMLLNMELMDVDTEIEKSQQMTINEIFRQVGEPRFREIETEMIQKLSERKDVIISTGGGAVLKQKNMDALRKQGIIISLMASPQTILKRTSHNSNRPLLKVEDPFEKIKELLNFRKPFYEKADILIDTEDKTPLQIAEEIIDKIKDSRSQEAN